MATNKKKPSSRALTTQKITKAELARQRAAQEAEEERRAAAAAAAEASRRDPDSPRNLIFFFSMLTLSLLTFIFLYFTDPKQGTAGSAGPLGYWFYCLCFGLLGPSAYLLPIGLFYLTITRNRCIRLGTTLLKTTAVFCFILFIAIGFQLMVQSSDKPFDCTSFPVLWNEGIGRHGGGVLGGMLGGALYFLLKNISWFILIPCLLIDILLLAEITPSMMRAFFARLAENVRAYLAERPEKSSKPAREKKPKEKKSKSTPVQREDAPLVTPLPAEEPLPVEPAPRRRQVFGVDDQPAPPPEPTMEVAPVELHKVTESGSAPDTVVVNRSTGEVIEPIYKTPAKATAVASDAALGEIFEPRRSQGKEKPGVATAPVGATAQASLVGTPILTTPVNLSSSLTLDDLANASTASADSADSGDSGNALADQLFAPKGEDPDLAPWEDPAPADPADLYGSDGDLFAESTEETPLRPLTPEEEEIAAFLLDTTREPIAEDTLPEYAQSIDLPEEPAKPIYRFPPLSLLSQNVSLDATDDSDELRRNGEKLVSVLKSFRVSTEIVNISHGPTITRYELAPKEGVRVRAIANLVDDIALNLETSGVRIEAPIPGKAAVGIEVPNKAAATVYLRELLEKPAFENSKSKVTCALGMDVAGTPIYLDIAKMPHLLIAGATGMGKSVCINSLIISLLYKATPDEVKLILIDPKKVELNVYNKLPHLLVPVVNLPKKAAGSLSWAVGEMERRFELIEEVGVRDIKGYNQVTANDPAKEHLPHIVIIIDELADLMMTAPDDVEESICRLAQKARAAGMHLIIGTQRPSVDVITGLIKANIPSRIAFTVASNIDSRTIIDVAGAEKLIGRGDMLYSPVGAMKPIRVQGSFVSDKEVEAVCDFIRAQVGDGEYNNAIIEEIDKNAEQCGQKKKPGAAADLSEDDASEIDPKFDEAVEVALEVGKISTSLLQRRLSLGYGRAAKIIDKMQQCGIVGPQEGQKPRNVLISRSDWNEIKMRSE